VERESADGVPILQIEGTNISLHMPAAKEDAR